MKTYRKRTFPPDEIRRFVEPGPIVLVSSQWKGDTNIMTMGWHTMLGFSSGLPGAQKLEGRTLEGRPPAAGLRPSWYDFER